MNLSTLAYKMMTGEWRLDRAYVSDVRAKLYAGGRVTGQRPTPNQLSSPEDPKPTRERYFMIRSARELEEDVPFADGLLNEFETYVVGDCGYTPATGNNEADLLIKDYFDLCADTCDYSGRFDLMMLSRLAVRSSKRDGELGWGLHEEDDQIKIEGVGGDRIGNPMQTWNGDPKNYNGIIINEKTMRPVKYQIFKRDGKTGIYSEQAEVKANNFLHYFNPFRVDQLHGVTMFKNSIEHLTDIKQIVDFTKLNIKWRSAQLPYVTNETGTAKGGSGYKATEVSGNPTVVTEDVNGVSVQYIKTGSSVVEFPNDFPNAQLGTILNHLKRDCSLGAKVPLEFFCQSENGGVIHRFFADKAMRTFNFEQRFLRRTLLDPFKNRTLRLGVDSGRLDLSRFGDLANSDALFKGTWNLGTEISVDYLNEVNADLQLIDASLASSDDYIESTGRDPRQVRLKVKKKASADIEDAQEIAKERGITWQEAMPFINKKFPNPVTPAVNPVQGSDVTGGGASGFPN